MSPPGRQPAGAPGPTVSIGLPVFNAARTVGRAVESLLAQTFRDFELLISDNASTDGTSEICRALAVRDARITYTRQAANIGASANFEFVLGQARAPFFMWAAADDYWEPRFIEATLGTLTTSPAMVNCMSRVVMPGAPRPGTAPLTGDPRDKVRAFIAEEGANSRFYGLWRSDVVRAAVREAGTRYIAADWAIVVAALRHGDFGEVAEPLMHRSPGGTSSRSMARQMRVLGARGIGWLFPYFDFARAIPRLLGWRGFLGCLDLLISLNVRGTAYHWIGAVRGARGVARQAASETAQGSATA